jgi:hypothetical protein
MLLLQFKNAQGERHVGILESDGKNIRVIEGARSTYELATTAIVQKRVLKDLVQEMLGSTLIDFDLLAKDGRLLSPLDHPDPAHCYVTGTGLTHLGSADTRDAMHKKLEGAAEVLTDSMQMLRRGKSACSPNGFIRATVRLLAPANRT